jgi:hypothetical protein
MPPLKFAKKLFFRQDSVNLKKLKVTLRAYLIAEQARENVDLKYDSFIASVAQFDENGRLPLPRPLQIPNWNYDTQLEKSFYGFCGDEDLKILMPRVSFSLTHFEEVGYVCACGR